MGTWQPAGAQGQGAVNGKDSVANDENTFENAPLQLFSLGQFAQAYFGGYFPDGSRRNEDFRLMIRNKDGRSGTECMILSA